MTTFTREQAAAAAANSLPERQPFTAAFNGDQAAQAYTERHPSQGGKTISPDEIAKLKFESRGQAR